MPFVEGLAQKNAGLVYQVILKMHDAYGPYVLILMIFDLDFGFLDSIAATSYRGGRDSPIECIACSCAGGTDTHGRATNGFATVGWVCVRKVVLTA